jgi:hypothetical protein
MGLMSRLETPMTLRYWETAGGTLIEEFLIVSAGPSVGRRLVDAVNILDGERRRATRGERVKLDGQDVNRRSNEGFARRHVPLGSSAVLARSY